MRLLLADPDAVTRDFVRERSEALGFEVEAFSELAAARSRLQGESAPRIVVVAHEASPAVKALCASARAESDRPYIFVILLANRSQRAEAASLLYSGAVDDILGKPVDAYDLEARLMAARRSLTLRERLVQIGGRLQRETMKDQLTGLWSRDATLGFLARELMRAGRAGRELSVVQVKLEGLEAVNQSLGIEAGNEAIRRVASTIETRVRSTDWVGRSAGRTFLIILPGCSRERGQQIAERMHRGVRRKEERRSRELMAVDPSAQATSRSQPEPALDLSCKVVTTDPAADPTVEQVLERLAGA